MINQNSYKISKKKLLLFSILFFFGLVLLVTSFNSKNFLKSEIQSIQKYFVSFSSSLQLFDSGNLQQSSDVKLEDVIPASKQILKIAYNGIFDNKNKNLFNISLFIKFENLNKIYNDREKAIIKEVNKNPKYVKCKISDGINIYNCKVKLKGDLEDHWYSKNRMSLRIEIIDGYILGLQNFSVHKPRARQFPYDQTFHKINSDLGGLSSNNQTFVNFRVNNQKWGVMNIEPTIDNKFIEEKGIKRLGVFRISNQENWIYRDKHKNFYLRRHHYISDPTLYISQRGNESKIMEDDNSREIYSFIFHSINTKNSKIFERQKMINNFILALSWGDLHVLSNANSLYTWNPYTHKLEAILSDQVHWKNVDETVLNLKKLPFEYSNIFKDSPITQKEYFISLNKIDNYINTNNPIKIANNFKNNFFPNDRMFEVSPIKKNISFLKDNHKMIVNWINNLSKNYHLDETPLNSKFKDDIKSFKNFIKVIHQTDGKIFIYNLLSKPVFISEARFDNRKIEINKKIEGSKENSISKIEITTDFTGKHDKKIEIVSFFDNIKKISKNEFSLISLDTLDNRKYLIKSDICKKKIDNICYISGKNIFNKSLTFDFPVIIEGGSELILDNNSHLYFKSSVQMSGSKNLPIFITGDGGSLTIFNNDQETSILNFVNFLNLSSPKIPLMRYTGSVNAYGGKFKIKNSNFFGGISEDQLNIVNAKVEISNLNFKDAYSDAFDCDFCNGFISDLQLNNIKGDALDFSGSKLNVFNVLISFIGDKALSIGESSIVNFDNIFIEESFTGVAVKDASTVKIESIKMKNILNDAFMTYIKKPYFYGNTRLKVSNLNMIDDIEGDLCVRQINTYVEINGDICDVSQIDVQALYENGRMKK
ncbi:hypothetical protein OAP15_01540 [Candidatus Pelagibacter sp.]|nr:hypothetical protein [Candidatus Pelagibacter sp.]MDC0642201.1 hypothetical protein [Candidatus Pelagibacter sp.]